MLHSGFLAQTHWDWQEEVVCSYFTRYYLVSGFRAHGICVIGCLLARPSDQRDIHSVLECVPTTELVFVL